MSSYTVGIDFGTESARAVVVDCADGRELGAAVYPYANGVLVEHLPAPDDDVTLPPDWALQDPGDYTRALEHAVPRAVAEARVDPADVVGVGICFTSCTMLPTTADGTPLCQLDDLRREPHAWVKLWKHHAAQPEADLINATALARSEPWLERYGDKISSEWFFPKSLQILREAPDVYARAERLIEATDWVVWQLTGVESRNSCTAGYKAMWSRRDGFPSDAYFAAVHPAFEHVVDDKLSREIATLGDRAGGLSKQAAGWTGLLAGTAVAVANVDAHVSAPAVGVTEPGTMVMIMGTSICHILLGVGAARVEGMCGMVEDGVVPGLNGFEAGQSAVGDIFAWFAEHGAPAMIRDEAHRRGVSVHEVLAHQAARLTPGESGVLALDWFNGNRSVLVDADLSGLLVGLTLATKPAEIYRALIEATAFGTRVIIEAFEAGGVPVTGLVVCGGLPERNKLLVQIYADVTARDIVVAASTQAPALGAAMFGAVAAGVEQGGHASIADATRRMAPVSTELFRPIADHRAVYDDLYAEYLRLHDLFGRGEDDIMRNLRRIQRATTRTSGGALAGVE